jgi:hypothetical protein
MSKHQFVRFKGRCERVRRNNGVLEVLISRRETFDDGWTQEEHVLFNIKPSPDMTFRKGQEYWVELRPAFYEVDSKEK